VRGPAGFWGFKCFVRAGEVRRGWVAGAGCTGS
jgi:hypothetical protein